MAFAKKIVPVVAEPVVESIPAVLPEGEAISKEDLIPEIELDLPEVAGSQFMHLISRDSAGVEVKAMQIGQRGAIVMIGFNAVFVPGADIVDRGQGKIIQ